MRPDQRRGCSYGPTTLRPSLAPRRSEPIDDCIVRWARRTAVSALMLSGDFEIIGIVPSHNGHFHVLARSQHWRDDDFQFKQMPPSANLSAPSVTAYSEMDVQVLPLALRRKAGQMQSCLSRLSPHCKAVLYLRRKVSPEVAPCLGHCQPPSQRRIRLSNSFMGWAVAICPARSRPVRYVRDARIRTGRPIYEWLTNGRYHR